MNDPDFSLPFTASIYDIEKSVLQCSDVIIDMSTSIGVERYLANEIKGVRKFSSFLNPMGTDLVMISEDIKWILIDLEIKKMRPLLTNIES